MGLAATDTRLLHDTVACSRAAGHWLHASPRSWPPSRKRGGGGRRTCCHHLRLALRILRQHQAWAVAQAQGGGDVERLQQMGDAGGHTHKQGQAGVRHPASIGFQPQLYQRVTQGGTHCCAVKQAAASSPCCPAGKASNSPHPPGSAWSCRGWVPPLSSCCPTGR